MSRLAATGSGSLQAVINRIAISPNSGMTLTLRDLFGRPAVGA